ncbi:MAG: hypothetical protein A2Z25_12675 [Planctomycetes bacterium RBG_16_55_9]|nr:MAG: hypothetical protein A2Z25_12675 [Planctomycetes bacterium RBG_16_55_9]
MLDGAGSGYLSDVTAGIDWAIENGMQIISLSMGTNYDYQTLRDACARADAAGIIVVAAAGNDYRNRRGRELDTVDYPARYDSVIAVGAIDRMDTKAYFSSTGSTLELVAPGVSIYSTYNGGSYTIMSGTSMAGPHVAGVAALILAGPGGDVRTVLQETAEDLGDAGRDSWYGCGLVNAATAAYEPIDIHDIAVSAIAAPNLVVQGDIVAIDVTVANLGALGETFDVTLNDDTDQVIIESKLSITLAAGASTTVTFAWNTAGVNTDAIHTLTATAGSLPDEMNIENNSLSTDVTVESPFTDVAVTFVEAPASAVQGDLVKVSVTVENLGNRNFTRDIEVVLTDNGTETAALLIAGGLTLETPQTITFTWNTGGALLGDHTLVATHNVSDDNPGNDSGSTVVIVEEKPLEPEEFTFAGTVAPRAESGHVVSVSTAGIMYVGLTWSDRGDLRLRIYSPDGVMAAQVDSSTWQNREEEIVIDVGPGDWTIAARSEDRRRPIDYTITGTVSY